MRKEWKILKEKEDDILKENIRRNSVIQDLISIQLAELEKLKKEKLDKKKKKKYIDSLYLKH